MVNRLCLKLASRYFGPYKVVAKVGAVSYKLELPSKAKVHPVFHISQLKTHIGQQPMQSNLPLLDTDGVITKELIAILEQRLDRRRGQTIIEVMV